MKVQSGEVKEIRRPRAAEEDVEAGSTLSLVDVFQMLNRHKWFVLGCVALGLVIAMIYAKRATRIFEASASFRIDPGRAGSLGLGDIAGGTGLNDAISIQTEIAIVRSDTVAVDTLNSLSDSVFAEYAGAEKRVMAFPTDSTRYTPAQEGLLAKVKGQLGARQLEGTQIVQVTFRDPNPRLAAIMANSVVAAYLRQSFDSRYGSVAQVRKWLSAEMDTLRTQAADSQRKLAEFQEKNDIFTTEGSGSGGPTSNTVTDRLAQLNTRVTFAESERITKEAQMRAALSGNAGVMAAMYPSGPVSILQSEHATLFSQIALLSTKFGPNYPLLAELKMQMAKIDEQADREIALIKDRLRQEYQTALTTENILRQQYDEQIEKAYALNRQQAEFAVLRAEGESRRALYNMLQVKLQQAGVEAGLSGINTMMVDEARVPLQPVEPKKTAIMTFGLAIGLFVGLASAFLKEAISDKVQSVESLERTLGYHILASIPHASFGDKQQASAAKDGSAIPPTLVSFRDPLSRISEAYRSMRNSILLSSLDKPAKTVLITSTIPGEGKSITTANYAVVLAQRGSKVLVIDADLRRPTLHKHFGAENLLGVSNLILGENVDSDVMKTPLPDLPNLTLITAGKKVPFPSEALGSARFHTIIEEWEHLYDYVIIDSAPLLIVSDSMPLAKWADAVVLVSRYNVTPIGALKRLRNSLRHTDVEVTGLIVNDTSGASAGYGEYGYDYYN